MPPPAASLALPIAVIQAALEALAMPPPRLAEALLARLEGAPAAAVDVAAVAARADRERALATGAHGESKPPLQRPHPPPLPLTEKAAMRPHSCDNPGRISRTVNDPGSTCPLEGPEKRAPGPHSFRRPYPRFRLRSLRVAEGEGPPSVDFPERRRRKKTGRERASAG